MSSRQLRKLQQQRELAQAKLRADEEAQEEEESEEEPISSRPSNAKPNLFANFTALEDVHEEASGGEQDEPDTLSEPGPIYVPKKPKKLKKKKKKKGKSKGKEVANTEEQDHGKGSVEIEAALRDLEVEKPFEEHQSQNTRPSLDPEYERVCKLVGVSSWHLKVGNEMRNLFGDTVMDNHDNARGAAPGRGRQRARLRQQQEMDLETALKGRHAPGKGLPELTLRRNYFIQGKKHWPKATTGGLAMAVVDDQSNEDGTMEFRYVHDSMYHSLQMNFHTFVEMGDPQNLIGLLIQNPYNISLLIQVSKIAKNQGDHALSSDLIERALFTFGRASTSIFTTKLSQGKARLDFARPENRELWLAGYQYIKSLVMKGTYRTAFEWAKCLLSLDPEQDPYCARLMLHHLALRAQEFEWLLDVSESRLLKFWAFDKEESSAISHILPSLAFAAMQLKDGAKSRKLLEQTMKRVPWLFCRLFKEINLDAPPSIWGIEPRSDAETLFTEIYVLQTKDLWNTPQATSLLMEIAHAIPKADLSKIPIVPNDEMTLDIVRFIYLENTPALMSLAPSRLLHRPNNSDSDPLPPDSNIYSYLGQKEFAERHDEPRGIGAGFVDPIAALARLFPQLRGNNDVDAPNIGHLLQHAAAGGQLQDIINDEHEGLHEEATTNHDIAPSMARRLLNMLFSYGDEETDNTEEEAEDYGDYGNDNDDDDDDDDDDEEFNGMGDEDEGADTDGAMPELV